jgi:hypothetical protein
LSTRKIAQQVNFTHYGGTGTKIAYQTEEQDPDNLNNWTQPIGQLKTQNTGFTSVNIKGRKFRFRLFGTSSGEPFTYLGYEIINILNEFLQFDE